MFCSTPLPEESAGSVLADWCVLNGLACAIEAVVEVRKCASRLKGGRGASAIDALAILSGKEEADFCLRHTHFPFMNAFNPDRVNTVDRKKVKLLAPLVAYCRSCAKEDESFHGRAYLRRSHSLPGVFWCSKHGFEPLVEIRLPRDLHWQKAMRTPALVHPKLHLHSSRDRAFFVRFSFACEHLMQHGCGDWKELNRELHDQGARRGLPELPGRRTGRGFRRLLSEAVLAECPQKWLTALFPSWRYKQPGDPDLTIDTGRLQHASTTLVVVLLASLYDAEELDRLFSSPLFHPHGRVSAAQLNSELRSATVIA